MKKKRIESDRRNAVIYARYSSHNQRDVSIEQQVQKCQEYAARSKLTVIGVYSDAAVSGKTDNRPQFQKMMRDSAKGGFDYVISWKSNRMGRNMLEAMLNDAKLLDEGVRCLYVEEDFADTAAGRFAKRNMMNINQFYSENMAEDIRRGLMDNASKCMVNLRPPLGYKKGEDKKYAIDEETAPIVREIFQRVLDGWSFVDIGADLNNRNIKTGYGREWNKNSFHALLKNEMYIGVYKYSTVRIEGGVPAIIDKQTFEEVQRFLRTKKKPVGRKNNCAEYLLTGKIFCGHCREPMVGISGTGKHGELHHYYACQGRRRRKNNCQKKNVQRDWIERHVVEVIKKYVLRDDVLEDILVGYEALMERLQQDSSLASMQKELDDTKKSIANLMKAIEQGIITDTTKDRLFELEENKKELENLIRIEQTMERDYSPELIRFYFQRFQQGDLDNREFQREIIKVFVQAIYLFDDHMTIVFNYVPNEEITVSFDDLEGDGDDTQWVRTDSLQLHQQHMIRTPASILVFAHGFAVKISL